MENITAMFYLLVVLCSLLAMIHWRWGLLGMVVIDIIRDPVRTLDSTESIIITLAGSVVLGGVIVGMLIQESAVLQFVLVGLRKLRRTIWWLVAALIPGGLLSMVLYQKGVLLAGIGAFSFLAPLPGIFCGILVMRRESDLLRVLALFCVLNSLAFTFNILELRGMDLPVLGGIQGMEWIRYQQNYTVNLIGGIYRSPDIMGLHAAYVMIFAGLLSVWSRSQFRWLWLVVAVWAFVNLILCGRRKMIGMPVVFVSVWILLGWIYLTDTSSRIRIPLVVIAAVAFFIGVFFLNQLDHSEDYSNYALTTFSEGGIRIRDNVLGGVFSTLNQSGILGQGLGTGTQGAHYLAIKGYRTWQEDGVSRLFVELGVGGVLLMLVASYNFTGAIRQSLHLLPSAHPSKPVSLGMWSVVAASVASYIISHQHFSGDPIMAFIAVLMVGCALGLPVWKYFEMQHEAKP